MSQEKKNTDAKIWFFLGDDLAGMTITHHGKTRRDAWQYEYEIYIDNAFVLSDNIWVTSEANLPRKNTEDVWTKPAHEMQLTSGWTLVPFAIRRHLRVMMNYRKSWNQAMQ